MNIPVMLHSVEGPPEERTLFLGDLSVYCSEEDIYQFFSQFGAIEKIRLKHATNNKNLSYAFVTYTHRDVAVRVLQTMNGQLFLGRALRLGWAAHKSQLSQSQIARLDASTPSAQIHVSFLSKQTDILITETTLRSLFERFGPVADVAIKKIQFNQKLKIQNGYGFVHFPLTKEGATAAITATNMIRQYTIDRVTYASCLTRSLEIVIESKLFPDLPEVIPYPEHANVVNKDYNNLQTYGNSGKSPTYAQPSLSSYHQQNTNNHYSQQEMYYHQANNAVPHTARPQQYGGAPSYSSYPEHPTAYSSYGANNVNAGAAPAYGYQQHYPGAIGGGRDSFGSEASRSRDSKEDFYGSTATDLSFQTPGNRSPPTQQFSSYPSYGRANEFNPATAMPPVAPAYEQSRYYGSELSNFMGSSYSHTITNNLLSNLM